MEEVLEHLQALRGDFGRFGDDFEKLGKHLLNCILKYEDAGKDLDKFGARLEHLEPLGESKSMPAKKIESSPAPQEAQREML